MRVKKNIKARKNTGRKSAGRKSEQGVIITLVAVFTLFVIGAMAALSIDVVTLYTARSEAQLVADGAALAGARVLANSGMTSDTTGASATSAVILATTVATQVANANSVGGGTLTTVNVTFNTGAPTFLTNPQVTVTVQKTNLPTFFARIWGRTQATVGASATAEAYNPTPGPTVVAGEAGPGVAPLCVKPWLLPNLDPTGSTPNPIFLPNGAVNSALLGQGWPDTGNANGLYSRCGDCSPAAGGIPAPAAGRYYPGAIDAHDFYVPATGFPLASCAAGFNPYQEAVAGCVTQPISCGGSNPPNSSVNIDTTPYGPTRDADTVQAAQCLTHSTNALDADSIDTSVVAGPPYQPPFQFLGGKENPVASAVNQAIMVSDSLVTIPVISVPPNPPTNPVTVIGFLQVFLNPQSVFLPSPNPGQIPVTIVNIVGCGTSVTGNPIIGNGASPVAVRLIHP
jgi:Flp pilus assembly protein TadG